MKNYTLSLAFFAVMIAFLVTGCAQQGSQAGGSDEKVTLALDVQEGQKFKLVQKMEQEISTKIMGMNNDMHQEMDFYFEYEVLGPKDDGHEMKITYNRIRYKVESAMMGTMVDYDSEDPDGGGGNPMMSAMKDAFSGLVGKSINMTMTKRGKVKDISGLEELYGMDGSDRGDMPGNLQAENVEKMMQGMMAIFPETQVGVGDTWGAETDLSGEFPLIMTTTYKVENIDAKTVYLNLDGEISTDGSAAVMPEGEGSIEMEGTQEGIMEVDRATGMILKAEYTQDITGEVEAGPVKAPMEIESKITIEPYE